MRYYRRIKSNLFCSQRDIVEMVYCKYQSHQSQILPRSKLVIQLAIRCEVMIQLIQLWIQPCISVTPSLC